MNTLLKVGLIVVIFILEIAVFYYCLPAQKLEINFSEWVKEARAGLILCVSILSSIGMYAILVLLD